MNINNNSRKRNKNQFFASLEACKKGGWVFNYVAADVTHVFENYAKVGNTNARNVIEWIRCDLCSDLNMEYGYGEEQEVFFCICGVLFFHFCFDFILVRLKIERKDESAQKVKTKPKLSNPNNQKQKPRSVRFLSSYLMHSHFFVSFSLTFLLF